MHTFFITLEDHPIQRELIFSLSSISIQILHYFPSHSLFKTHLNEFVQFLSLLDHRLFLPPLTLIVTGSKINALSQGGDLRGPPPKKLSICVTYVTKFNIMLQNNVLVCKKNFGHFSNVYILYLS